MACVGGVNGLTPSTKDTDLLTHVVYRLILGVIGFDERRPRKGFQQSRIFHFDEGGLDLLYEASPIIFLHIATDGPVVIGIFGGFPDDDELFQIDPAGLHFILPYLEVYGADLIAAGLDQGDCLGVVSAEAHTLEYLPGRLLEVLPDEELRH
jgi:hypothetical protein